jgi:single-strand DNA-binding protein
MSVNKVILVGRLGTEPELRQTKSGFSVVNVRVATNERRKDGDQWVDHTEWHTVTMWGKVAENVSKYCTKGKQLYIEGRIQTRDFTDKNGIERKATEVVADQVKFLGDRSDSQARPSVPTNGHPRAGAGQQMADAEVPF